MTSTSAQVEGLDEVVGVDFEDAIYHQSGRGNARQAVFYDESD
jgi:hypothetical protein